MNAATRPAAPVELTPVTRAIPHARIPTDLEVVEPQWLSLELETDIAIGIFSLLAESLVELRHVERSSPFEQYAVVTDGCDLLAYGRDEFDALDNALGEL